MNDISAGIELHASWNYNLMIPDVVNITQAKVHDRYGIEQLIFPKDTIIVEDRAYFNSELMFNRIKANNVFVTRIKINTVYETIEELELPDNIDQKILEDEENKVIIIITNQLDWEYKTFAELNKKRRDIELIFKSLK